MPSESAGTASTDRRQWGDLRRSSGSVSSGGGGRKQEAVTPQKQQPVARSQTLPRGGSGGGGGGGYATGSPSGKGSPAKPLKSALRSSSALSRSTSLPPRRATGAAAATTGATAAGSSSGHAGGGGLNPKPRAPGYADMPSPVQRQKSAGRTQHCASPAARRRGGAVSKSLSALPTSQAAKAAGGSARGDGESAAQAVASMLQRVANKK